MPTRGIWAPWPGAQLLLAIFLPFLTRGGGIALAMAKPLVYPRAQLRFLTPRSPISWLQEEVPLGSAAQSHPAWGEVGRRVDGGERCASGVPKSQVPGTLLPRDQPSQRATRFAAIPVAAASAGAAVASETVCTPGAGQGHPAPRV